MNKGLFNKYIVKKTDGSPVDPKAEYFVLRIDTDPHARKALLTYADSIQAKNPTLANDLREWVHHWLGGELEYTHTVHCFSDKTKRKHFFSQQEAATYANKLLKAGHQAKIYLYNQPKRYIDILAERGPDG